MKRILAGSVALAFCTIAHSQSICEAIIRSANYNQYQSVSQNQQYSLQKANFCLAEYDKSTSEQRAQIEASYKVFSGSASGSSEQIRERQRTECDSKYGEYWFSQLGLVSQKVVSDKAMDTVAQCVKAFGSGLRVEPTFSETETALTVALTWTRSSDLPFRGIIRTPSESVKCRLENRDVGDAGLFNGRVIRPGTSATFSCERTAKIETISGEQVSCLPEALVAIDVLESPVTLNLFRRCNTDYLIGRAKKVEGEVQALRSELAALRSQTSTGQSAIGARVERLEGETKYGGAFQKTDAGVDGTNQRANPLTGALSCPSGYRAVEIARVRTAEPGSGVGAIQYSCVKP
jgi:hypothetical protein